MKICFFPLNIDAAGCYRCIFPMAYLGLRGHEALMPSFQLFHQGQQVAPLPGPGVLERVPAGDFEVGFIEQSIPPELDVAVFHIGTHDWQLEWARRLKRRGVAIVLDTDDDVHRSPSYNPAVLHADWSPRNNVRNASSLARLADLVTCATDNLAEFYTTFNRNVTVVRNALHWPMWSGVGAERTWRRFRIGYMGTVAFHSADIELLRPLRKWLVSHPDVEFVAAGDDRIHDVIGVPESQRVSTGKVWFRNLDLASITGTMDVGLVPLVKNDFNESKSALKGMEYAACGIPCVASPTLEYRRWLDSGDERGLLAKHPRDFVDAVDQLLADHGRRRDMGVAARAAARAASLDQHIHEWEEAYGRLLSGRAHAEPAGARSDARPVQILGAGPDSILGAAHGLGGHGAGGAAGHTEPAGEDEHVGVAAAA